MRFFVSIVFCALALLLTGCGPKAVRGIETPPSPQVSIATPSPRPTLDTSVPFDASLFEPSKEKAARDKKLGSHIKATLDETARKRIYWEIWVAEGKAIHQGEVRHPEPPFPDPNYADKAHEWRRRVLAEQDHLDKEYKQQISKKWNMGHDGLDMIDLIGREGTEKKWAHPD